MYFLMLAYYFFFFKQKTAYEMRISDWTSDVCSSDLEAEERHGGRQHTGPFILRFIEQFARGRSDDGMDACLAQMRGQHHRLQRGFHRPLRVRQEIGDTGQGLVGFGVEDVQDRANQQRVAGLFPMVALLKAAFGVDQDVGDILDVPYLPFAAPYFEQRVVGGRRRIGRIEQQHLAEPRAKTGGQTPVLALDVVNDRSEEHTSELQSLMRNSYAVFCLKK